jgi:hypothetical protein
VFEGAGQQDAAADVPGLYPGLIGLGDRKSIQPMAACGDALTYDRLRHFIGAGL